MSDWRDDLRPASWRGLPFGVWTTESRFGRRTATHEYPFRDPVWVEDLGRGVRKFGLVGFLVGDDVVFQTEAMAEAAEAEGPGELVHPTLGMRTVNLIDFGASTRHDLGRVTELAFTFIEAGERLYPETESDPGAAVKDAANAADIAAKADFSRQALGALQQGAEVVQQVQRTVGVWTATASRLAGSVRNVVGAVGRLVPGLDRSFGRFLTGSRSPLALASNGIASVSDGLRLVSRARTAVAGAVSTVTRLAGLL